MQSNRPVVRNKKFALLLKSLLTGNAPSIDIQSIKKSEKKYLFIDVRDDHEFEVSTIKGAILAESTALPSHIPKDQPIILFCSIGLRSEKACLKMMEAGYSDVCHLYGGIFEWINEGLPVVDSKGEASGFVHGFSPFWGIWVNGIKKVYGKSS